MLGRFMRLGGVRLRAPKASEPYDNSHMVETGSPAWDVAKKLRRTGHVRFSVGMNKKACYRTTTSEVSGCRRLSRFDVNWTKGVSRSLCENEHSQGK